ncbi:bifunctional DNA primase/polymerase [Streptomyces sp. NPDC059637]|uniref:bifunctional DNA primase/polymerase n=1 Tax=Streptomyces sp. NPDC059637 TaxID=3347752 RepID=UPI00368E957D
MSGWIGHPEEPAERVTPDGLAWLASASRFPRSVVALWSAAPSSVRALPCGALFDAVSLPALFGRRVLDQLWTAGPGSGPAARQGGRLTFLTAPGTADRLPSLLDWEEWGDRVPPPLCHGLGDEISLPPLVPAPGSRAHWVVAPRSRTPWLPGPGVLLWACIRAARAGTAGTAGTAGAAGASAGAGPGARVPLSFPGRAPAPLLSPFPSPVPG